MTFPAPRTLTAALAAVLSFSVLGTAGVLWSPSATAAGNEDIGWQVQPHADKPGTRPYFVYDVDPGQTIEDTVVIGNLGRTPLPLTVFGTDALNAEDGRFDLLETVSDPTDVGSWVTLSKGRTSSITVDPEQERSVDFSITVPENATPGDHVGGIVTSHLTQQKNDEGEAVQLDSRVAARIYLFVKGDLNPALEVSDVQVDHDASLINPLSGTATVSWSVRNTGNLRLAGNQRVSIGGVAGWGSSTTSVDLPEILPGNEVRQTTTIKGVPAAVRLAADVVVAPRDPSERSGDTIDPVGAGASIWTIPWTLLVLLALAALGTWALLAWQRRQRAVVAELREELERHRETADAGR